MSVLCISGSERAIKPSSEPGQLGGAVTVAEVAQAFETAIHDGTAPSAAAIPDAVVTSGPPGASLALAAISGAMSIRKVSEESGQFCK